MAIKIIGTGSYTPDRVLRNADLEKMVDTNDEWIRTRTGIVERRIADDGVASSDLALKASQQALSMAGLNEKELDLIIVASITPDKAFPSTACILQRKLGAGNSVCFDVHAACSGLLYGLEVASALLRVNERYTNALVVGAEKLTSLVDWEDRNTCVLFGDGSGAILLSKTDDSEEEDFLVSSKLGANGDYENILHVPAGGSLMPPTHETVDQRLHFMKMEGQEVFKLAVNAMVKSCQEVLRDSNIDSDSIRWLIPHQANLRILKAVGARLGVDQERIYINVDKYGNTSAASVGIALDEIVRSDLVVPGDYLLLTAFGGGLTWGAVLVRW